MSTSVSPASGPIGMSLRVSPGGFGHGASPAAEVLGEVEAEEPRVSQPLNRAEVEGFGRRDMTLCQLHHVVSRSQFAGSEDPARRELRRLNRCRKIRKCRLPLIVESEQK